MATTQRDNLWAAREAIIKNSVTRMVPGANRRYRDGGNASDTGAAMVELAFVMVLLVMLLVGTVSSAMAFGRDNSIQNAAREASRFGATLPGAADAAWLQQIRDVARSAASGDLDASVPGSVVCAAFIDADNNPISLDDDSMTTSPTPCFTDDRPDEAKVQVAVQRDTEFQAIVFSTDITLTSDAAARYER